MQVMDSDVKKRQVRVDFWPRNLQRLAVLIAPGICFPALAGATPSASIPICPGLTIATAITQPEGGRRCGNSRAGPPGAARPRRTKPCGRSHLARAARPAGHTQRLLDQENAKWQSDRAPDLADTPTRVELRIHPLCRLPPVFGRGRRIDHAYFSELGVPFDSDGCVPASVGRGGPQPS